MGEEMISLGIESTAHTFGIGIISDKKKILFNQKNVYIPKKGSGIHPRKAAQSHLENSSKIIKNALKKVNPTKIDIFSYSQGPGIPNCLQIGSSIARILSLKYNKPLIGINHCVAHIEIAKLMTNCKDPVILYCSGGNTQIISYIDGKYRIFGETEDIPVGNAFDVLARKIGFLMPGGPKIEILAKKGKWTELPYVVKGMDFSFTGIVTECIKKMKNGEKKEDICYSFQETVYSMLTEVTERVISHLNKKNVLITGGVAASRRLHQIMNKMCKPREVKIYVINKKFAGDNGLMIAWNGFLAYKSGQKTTLNESKIIKNWRTDEVEISWL
jgi:N6-L-threonylcarbamoyladenine synthase/protein kinase Bud32